MTNDFSVNKNKDLPEFNPNLNSETFTYGQKDGEQFKLGIFNLLNENNDLDLLKSKLDTNSDGKVSDSELSEFQQKFADAAGDDKILQKNEILKLFGFEEESQESVMLNGQMQALIQSSKGGTIKQRNDFYNTKIIKNPDKTGVEYFKNEGINGINILGKNGKWKEQFNVTYSDHLTSESYDVQVTNHTVYSPEGRIIEHTFIYPGEKVTEHVLIPIDKNPFIRKTSFEYYSDGSKKSEIIEETDNKTKEKSILIKHFDEKGNETFKSDEYWTIVNGKMSHMFNSKTTVYDSEGNKTKEISFLEDRNGKKTNEEMTYQNNQLIEKHLRQEKGDNIIVDDYYGENVENRNNKLPSTRIIYAKDGTTIKSKTENEFDKDGILIKQTVYSLNKHNKLKKKTYDVSGLNRKYEPNVYQGSVGNCYLMESMISMSLTKPGHKLLRNIITPETVVDENGKATTIYHAHLAGVEPAKQYLIDNISTISNGEKSSIDPNDITIKPDYIISSDEYKQAQIESGKNYSFGDKEYLLPEIAYAKFREDAESTLSKNNLYTFGYEYISGMDRSHSENTISGGQSFIAMYILSGKKSDIYFNPADKVNICTIDEDYNIHLSDKTKHSSARYDYKKESDAIANRYNDYDEYYNTIKDDLDKHGHFKNHAIFAHIFVSTQEVNGQPVQDGGHAIVVKGFKDDKVILVNPWDGTKDLKMQIDEFKQAVIAFGGIDCR